MDLLIRPPACRGGISHERPVRVLPAVALMVAWAQAVAQGRLDVAAAHRRCLAALTAEEPSWEDAEWR